ncbi:MAG: RHS repeat-associated core domain-containing protein, partial [Bacteroidales bacterium]|nr:RHS repeat-associated core domain-containing protein [Bacteroidales bacterium]
HLGSASWVTDTAGHGYEHFQYNAWGGPFITQRITGGDYQSRYTFSGKERDEETGFSYFGSRYYNSSLSIWLSVDPMADMYPSTSPYTYCANNPVRLVDADGREVSENLDKWRYNTSTGRLSWISDEGGQSNQTVEFVHRGSDGKLYYNQTKSVSYNGTIGDMFDFSVISPSTDKIISGSLSIFSGVLGAAAGIVIGAGGGMLTGGAATFVGAAICAASGTEIVGGIVNIAEAFSVNKIAEHNMVKDICHSLGSYAVGNLSKPSTKGVALSLGSLTLSLAWTAAQIKSALYPDSYKIPEGAKYYY